MPIEVREIVIDADVADAPLAPGAEAVPTPASGQADGGTNWLDAWDLAREREARRVVD